MLFVFQISKSPKKIYSKKLTKTSFIVVKLYFFVRFLEEMSAWKNHFDFVWPLRKKAKYTFRNHWFTCDFTNSFTTVWIDFAQLSLELRTPPVCPLLFTSLIKVLFDESASTHLTYCHVAYNSKYWGQNLFAVSFELFQIW